MVGFGWFVLALLFLDELLAMAALGVWGWGTSAGWLLVWLAPLAAGVLWFLFASPKAPYGGTVARLTVKILVFSLASLALWAAGHPDWALALLLFSLVVNGLATLPSIKELVPEHSVREG